jgi:hypothetical protein
MSEPTGHGGSGPDEPGGDEHGAANKSTPPADQRPQKPARTYTRRRVVVGGATAFGAAVVWSAPWPFSDSLIGQTIQSAWGADGVTGPTGTTGPTGSGGGGGGGSTTTTTTTAASTTTPTSTTAPGTTTVPATTGPTAPSHLTGRFQRGALRLAWGAASSPGGTIAYYQVLSDGVQIAKATKTSADVRRFDKHGTTTFTVRAVDSLGKTGAASGSIKVVPVPRPTGTPHRIPKWAWELAAWQERPLASRGRRPTTPIPVPRWFWAWKAWRLAPYKLAG